MRSYEPDEEARHQITHAINELEAISDHRVQILFLEKNSPLVMCTAGALKSIDEIREVFELWLMAQDTGRVRNTIRTEESSNEGMN